MTPVRGQTFKCRTCAGLGQGRMVAEIAFVSTSVTLVLAPLDPRNKPSKTRKARKAVKAHIAPTPPAFCPAAGFLTGRPNRTQARSPVYDRVAGGPQLAPEPSSRPPP